MPNLIRLGGMVRSSGSFAIWKILDGANEQVWKTYYSLKSDLRGDYQDSGSDIGLWSS